MGRINRRRWNRFTLAQRIQFSPEFIWWLRNWNTRGREWFRGFFNLGPGGRGPMSLINGRPLLTIYQVAEYLHCSEATVRRLIASRRLAAIKRSGDYSRTLIWAVKATVDLMLAGEKSVR